MHYNERSLSQEGPSDNIKRVSPEFEGPSDNIKRVSRKTQASLLFRTIYNGYNETYRKEVMYNPHLSECGVCLQPFKDGQRVYHWFEDYICGPCAPVFIQELGSHIWHENPKNDIALFQ